MEKQKVEMIAHEEVKPHDDRDDLVDVVYGANPGDYTSERVTKRQAFEILYDYYSDMEDKMVPRNWPVNKKLRELSGRKVNNDTVYVKMRYKDATRQMITVVKDLPMWIAVERAITHNHHVELITKAEHDKFYRDRQYEQEAWMRQAADERERVNAMTGK